MLARFVIVFSFFAQLSTYILGAIHTFQGQSDLWLKILVALTLDVILAFIWPITWALWTYQMWAGYSTPVDFVF